ncbi:MAG: DUF427 domain-containing protein, partial [Planctomycetota bacterium]
IADSTSAKRVLETSHPPVYYIPPVDIRMDLLQEERSHRTLCEWKGYATYYSIEIPEDEIPEDAAAGTASAAPADGSNSGTTPRRCPLAAWAYHEPVRAFRDLKDYLAFYPSKMQACYVGDERVHAQEGDFYGGWITDRVVGPFKGGPGTLGW